MKGFGDYAPIVEMMSTGWYKGARYYFRTSDNQCHLWDTHMRMDDYREHRQAEWLVVLYFIMWDWAGGNYQGNTIVSLPGFEVMVNGVHLHYHDRKLFLSWPEYYKDCLECIQLNNDKYPV